VILDAIPAEFVPAGVKRNDMILGMFIHANPTCDQRLSIPQEPVPLCAQTVNLFIKLKIPLRGI
jgi:hypothetical protein